MKYEIRKIEALPFAKILTLITTILGLLGSVVWYFIFSFLGTFGGFNSYSWGGEFLIPVGIMTIIMAVFGFIAGLFFAIIYNWLAHHIGGIKLEIDLAEQEKTQ